MKTNWVIKNNNLGYYVVDESNPLRFILANGKIHKYDVNINNDAGRDLYYVGSKEEAQALIDSQLKNIQIPVFGNIKLIEACIARAVKLGYTIDYTSTIRSRIQYLVLFPEQGRIDWSKTSKSCRFIDGDINTLFYTDKYKFDPPEPEIKVGCQTVNFSDNGLSITVQNEEITFEKVEQIRERMLSRQKSKTLAQ